MNTFSIYHQGYRNLIFPVKLLLGNASTLKIAWSGLRLVLRAFRASRVPRPLHLRDKRHRGSRHRQFFNSFAGFLIPGSGRESPGSSPKKRLNREVASRKMVLVNRTLPAHEHDPTGAMPSVQVPVGRRTLRLTDARQHRVLQGEWSRSTGTAVSRHVPSPGEQRGRIRHWSGWRVPKRRKR